MSGFLARQNIGDCDILWLPLLVDAIAKNYFCLASLLGDERTIQK